MKSPLESSIEKACERAASSPRTVEMIKRMSEKKDELEKKHAKEMYDAMELIYKEFDEVFQ